jgi:predicted 3-demethylubiquinone-9 3-methyltransferase (glyoxalase superfamily)
MTEQGVGARMAQKITTFLMFDGQAEAAIAFYMSLFRNAAVTAIKRYGPGEAGREGSVVQATFTIGTQSFMCIDSPVRHNFDFTPAISLFVRCDSEAEIEELFARLSKGGHIMMPLDNYPFSAKYAWLSDRFGVSWQLSLPAR